MYCAINVAVWSHYANFRYIPSPWVRIPSVVETDATKTFQAFLPAEMISAKARIFSISSAFIFSIIVIGHNLLFYRHEKTFVVEARNKMKVMRQFRRPSKPWRRDFRPFADFPNDTTSAGTNFVPGWCLLQMFTLHAASRTQF